MAKRCKFEEFSKLWPPKPQLESSLFKFVSHQSILDMTMWWVPWVWHTVTLPFKNPGYAPGISVVKMSSYFDAMLTLRCVHSGLRSMWNAFISCVSGDQNSQPNEEISGKPVNIRHKIRIKNVPYWVFMDFAWTPVDVFVWAPNRNFFWLIEYQDGSKKKKNRKMSQQKYMERWLFTKQHLDIIWLSLV